tara:strand:- start:17155 stop:18249 length:1095 start_codon:yes stop_codon:yes gene_type:complete
MTERNREIHIIGIVGLPAKYGGFETLVDQLLESEELKTRKITVYCDKSFSQNESNTYKKAILKVLPWKANGWQSIVFDALGIYRASKKNACILILGTSSTFLLPYFRLVFPKSRYVVNMAGLEWSRSKWGFLARLILRFNEFCAAKYSHALIADNKGLVEYVKNKYNVNAQLIAYGGDQHQNTKLDNSILEKHKLPEKFDFGMARAQSDNNLEIILETYASTDINLVFVSNWQSSEFGKKLYNKFCNNDNLFLLDPIYDSGMILSLHSKTRLYVHGHCSGGTNPVLVEAMWSGLPTAAFDVVFNQETTLGQSFYFKNTNQLLEIITNTPKNTLEETGKRLLEIAKREYSWSKIRSDYERLILFY